MILPFSNVMKAQSYTTTPDLKTPFAHTTTSSYKLLTIQESENYLFVNPNSVRHEILGIGGAITDASAVVYDACSSEMKAKIMQAYFDPEYGLGYSVVRTTVHSCDFSPASYCYVKKWDKELKSFSIEHDLQYRIPMIQDAIATARHNLMIYASPRSPPAWMKTNKSLYQWWSLLPKYHDTRAQYLLRFIQEYEKVGINLRGLTIQNEAAASQRRESCLYTAQEEIVFALEHLRPALDQTWYENLKLIARDHNRDYMYQRAIAYREYITQHPELPKHALRGIGYHRYETRSNPKELYPTISDMARDFPEFALVFTEGCQEGFDAKRLYDRSIGRRYSAGLIRDLQQGTCLRTDWNIVLDMNGGPNHADNKCFAPLHVFPEYDIIHFTPSYYHIGHISRWVTPGSHIIGINASKSHLISLAAQRPDGKIVIVVSNKEDISHEYHIVLDQEVITLTIPPLAIQTTVIEF